MRRPAIDQLVYNHMFPRPKNCDPSNFSGILTRFLVFEVRQEVHSFYGHLDTQEAKYPGLDYCHPIHRIRLSRWPWHRRLFRAFDALRLTPTEIADLTQWEGTLWAKERYEKEQNLVIEDTAADGMPDYRHAKFRKPEEPQNIDTCSSLPTGSQSPAVHTNSEDTADECLVAHATATLHTHSTPLREQNLTIAVQSEDEVMDSFGSDLLIESGDGDALSVGIELNEAHGEGNILQQLDEDWEQWLKNALETGNLNVVAQHMPLNDLPFVHSRYTSPAHADISPRLDAGSPFSDQGTSTSIGQTMGSDRLESETTYFNIIPSQILHSARLGRWDEIPDFLHEVLRQAINNSTYQEAAASPRDAQYFANSADTVATFAHASLSTILNRN